MLQRPAHPADLHVGVRELGDKAPTPKLEDGLYAASAQRMLTVINHVPDTVTTLMVISHMPGVQDLAMHLASRDSDHDAYMDAATRYPTSAMTVHGTRKAVGRTRRPGRPADPLRGSAPQEVAPSRELAANTLFCAARGHLPPARADGPS